MTDGILVAAHELKAPLCLLRQLALSLPEAERFGSRAHLESQIVEVSERALRQVEDLTKISRLADSHFTMEPVGVRGVCESVVRELTPLFTQADRRLSQHYANRSRLAIANRDLLYSIIYNFCANALHYAGDNTPSELRVLDRQNYIQIRVRDFGPALPTKIWREFQHGGLSQPTSIAMRPGSSGLGLYIVTQFAHHMRAELCAIRHRDGTSFFVNLPVSHQASLFSRKEL